MQRMDPKKAQGYDNIPSKFLRIGASGICSHVSQLVNHCFRVCEFPDIMKLTDVSSLYKKNDNLKKDNYRPVSVLPSLSKVYERVMGQQLSDFFDKIFSALLSAFRKRYSCQSTLLDMIEHFKRSLDNGEYVACLSMDLSKAFDCLPNCLTICKLYSYGVSRETCTLIASYLRDRKQRIKLGSSRSEWTELLKGVPQGSILGPLIFNIFLNDILIPKEICITTPMIIVLVSRTRIYVWSAHRWRMKPKLWLNGLLITPWKQTWINSKVLYYPGVEIIALFRFH